LIDLQRKLDEAEHSFEGSKGKDRMLREEVTEDDIAEIISKWTGIPVSKLRQSERCVTFPNVSLTLLADQSFCT